MSGGVEVVGRVDISVNNAGIIQVGPMPTAVEEYETALHALFWAMLYPTLAVLPQMRARHRGPDCEYHFHWRHGQCSTPAII
jgi:NADP-dependent 3-hydroxy acid dehydrogenase YdfG